MMEEMSESMAQPYSLPFDDHLMSHSMPEWDSNCEFIELNENGSNRNVVFIVPESDESLNSFLLNDDGDVIDFKSIPVDIDQNNPLFNDEINEHDMDNLLLQIDATEKNKKAIDNTGKVPKRSNSVPIIANKEQYLACIEDAVSPKSTFIDIDQSTPPKSISLIEPISFSPVKSPVTALPYKSRGKTLGRMVSTMSGLRKIAIPKDAVLSSDDEVNPNGNRKIKLIHVTPEFKNELRRSNRIAKVPIRNLKVFNNDTSPVADNSKSPMPLTTDTLLKTADVLQTVAVSSQVISKPKEGINVPCKVQNDFDMVNIETNKAVILDCNSQNSIIDHNELNSELVDHGFNSLIDENKNSELVEHQDCDKLEDKLLKNKNSDVIENKNSLVDKNKDSIENNTNHVDNKTNELDRNSEIVVSEINTKSLDSIEYADNSTEISSNILCDDSKSVKEIDDKVKSTNADIDTTENANIMPANITKKKEKDNISTSPHSKSSPPDKISSSKNNIIKQKKKDKLAKLKSQSLCKKIIDDVNKKSKIEHSNTDSVADSKTKSAINLHKKSHKHSIKVDKKSLRDKKSTIDDNIQSKINEIEVTKKKTIRLLQPSELNLIPIISSKPIKKLTKKHPSKRVSTISAPTSPSIRKIQRNASFDNIISESDIKSTFLQTKSTNSKQESKPITENSLNISINKVINKIQPKVQNSTKLIDIKEVKPLIKDTANSSLVKKEVKKFDSPEKKMAKNCDKKNEINIKESPPVPDARDYSKKLTLSSYRKRRKLRPKSVVTGTIIVEVNEPFFKSIPDHSYCHKNKGLASIDDIKTEGIPEETMQPIPKRIRHTTDNSVVDMDIDSEKDEKSDNIKITSNQSFGKADISFTDTKSHINKSIFTSPLASSFNNSSSQNACKESLESRLQPPVSTCNRRNVAFSTSSPDIAEQSASTSPSSDSNAEAMFLNQSDKSADTTKNCFKSTFKPVDFTPSESQILPVIFDIHEKTMQSNRLKRSHSVLSSNVDSNIKSSSSSCGSKQLYVTDANEASGLTYTLNNNNNKESCSNKNQKNNTQYNEYSSDDSRSRYNKSYSSDSSDYGDYRNDYDNQSRTKRRRRSSYRRSPYKRPLLDYKRKEFEERRTVYVGRIPSYYVSSDLEMKFESFGQIDHISIHLRDEGDNYGFITFRYTNDAFNAIENGNRKEGCQDFDMCFGGRRHFCKQKYADLDGNLQDDEEIGTKEESSSDEMDFDAMLRAATKSIKKR